MTEFGCPFCYGEEAGTASINHRAAKATHVIIDDSHFIVTLPKCPECGQRFLRIFTEFVDWQGGDDAQYIDVLPITEEEAERIVQDGEEVSLQYLGSLGANRRRLQMDWPSGGQRRLHWVTGTFHVQEGH